MKFFFSFMFFVSTLSYASGNITTQQTIWLKDNLFTGAYQSVQATDEYSRMDTGDYLFSKVTVDYSNDNKGPFIQYYKTTKGHYTYDHEVSSNAEYTEAVINEGFQKEFHRYRYDIWALFSQGKPTYDVISASSMSTSLAPRFCHCGTVTISNEGKLPRNDADYELP